MQIRTKFFAFRNLYIPFDPLYPNCWRGEFQIVLFVFWTAVRFQFSYRKADHWFYFKRYYAGNFRNLYHLSFWRTCFSVLPSRNWSGL